jgi:hypothetical protein
VRPTSDSNADTLQAKIKPSTARRRIDLERDEENRTPVFRRNQVYADCASLSAIPLETLGIDHVHDIDVDLSKHRDRNGSIRSNVIVI